MNKLFDDDIKVGDDVIYRKHDGWGKAKVIKKTYDGWGNTNVIKKTYGLFTIKTDNDDVMSIYEDMMYHDTVDGWDNFASDVDMELKEIKKLHEKVFKESDRKRSEVEEC